MSLTDRVAALTPEQRALFEKLREKQLKAAARPAQPPPIQPVSGPTGEGDWPLSLDQERFWFMEQLYPGGAGLNISAASRMRGPVSVARVAAALDGIALRHAAWRTSFPSAEGRPVQRVSASGGQRLALVDLSGLPGPRREAEALWLVGVDSAAPFDLERGPLVRASLLRLGVEDHVCLLTIHHLVTDWISFQIVWSELAALYASRSAALPWPPVQYPDFAVWQREWLQGEVLEGLVSWWRERLADFPLVLELPTDRPRPAVARMRGDQRFLSLSRELTEGLRNLARQEGATLFMALLASTAALLSRHTGQERLILGANNANRNRPEIEGVLGCFLTQVPFPIDLTGDPAFRELLARMRQSALGALAHQDLPFGKLVEAVQPERDTSRQPVVQALVQVLEAHAAKATLAGVDFEPVDAFDGNARYDLMLSLFDSPAGLAGSLEYDVDLFDGGSVERLLGRLQALMAAVVADPGLRLESIPLLTPSEQEQVVRAEQAPPVAVEAACVHDLIAARDAVAVICGAERLTYRELVERAGDLAHRLRSLGVGPEVSVVVCAERSARLAVALLGVLQAGGVYVPIDPEDSPSRIAFVLRDSGAAALVTQPAIAARLPAMDIPVVDLDAPLPRASVAPSPVLPENLAYLIYTSGSTGLPKGVGVSHAAAVEHLRTWARVHGVVEGDRFLQFNSASFDPAVEQCITTLASGATLVMRGPELWDPDEITQQVARHGVTIVDLPTAVWSRWVAEAGEGMEVPPAVRRVLIGGEELRTESVRQWSRTPLARLPLLNGYGPTEAVVSATQHEVRPEDGEAGPVSIGGPLPGRVARVLGPGGSRQPVGVPGELCLGGLLARGYLGRPALTAERFVPDPYASVPGARLYRTGDLVRRRPGGDLEFLGRIDDQVKIRGFRVEPGEVEAALLAHPAVREAAVLARKGQLVAWYAGDAGDLGAFLRKSLPEYMIPAAFVALPRLPLTTHGKVDRRALPEPVVREAPSGSAPPRNAREELLAGIWRGVLDRDRIGIHDNFFQLGGDSILSIQVVARARRAGLLLTTRQFFEHQTIAGLAAVAGSPEAAPAEAQGPVEGEVPLTPIQRRFFEEGRREPWRYNQAVLLASRERLEAPPLAASLARLARHHDALRLRFLHEEEGWRQIHAPGASLPLAEIDLREVPEALEAAAERLQSGLDLARGPVFTAALFRLGKEGDRLLLTAHHLIVDGVSWRVLLEDLAAAYRGLDLPPKTTSWKRWAELLAVHARELEEEISYWFGLPSTPPLPIDLEADGGMATVSIDLGPAETRALLQEAPEVYRTQVNDLLLAALARTFAAWTGEGTLLVDLEGHGREEIFPGVDLSRTVGWFTTLFPVALALPPGAGPREAIQTVKETLRAVPRRGLGYGLLAGRLTEAPKPQVSFNYLGRLDAPAGEDGPFALVPQAIRGTEGEAVPARHLFAVDLVVLENHLRVSWTYDPGRHLPATVERLARGFLDELEALVEHCLSPEAGGYTPSDFPLAGLDRTALDRLLGSDRGVEDLYPLAPLQEGLLFHSLYSEGADLYFEQLTAELEGPLDAPAFAAAWQRVVDRHTALRTGFLWKDFERSLQLVRRQAELPWTLADWRGLPDLDERWKSLLAADRARGFDLLRPPLMRLALVRTAEDSHRLVWSSHHLILDGWCLSLILSEVFALYQDREACLPPARPYRDYIAWLAHRDDAEAERHWRESLRGFTEPTPVPFDHPGGSDGYCERTITLRAAALETLAQRLQVTLSSLVQGAWALLLSRYAQASDVVFGAVVSGRPAELPGVEAIVGLFINTVPVRIGIPEEEPASAWLGQLQAGQLGLRQYQWTPLSRVQALSEVPAGQPLFASLLVFENYPLDPSVSESLGDLRVGEVALPDRTNYPLTLTVVPRGDLSVRLTADRRFEPATVERLLQHLENLLGALAGDPERPPRSLPVLSEGERRQMLVDWNDTASAFPSASIPELFAEQVALRPDAVALEQGDARLTYGELQGRAERVARRLVAAGVRPEERVAVLAERSLDLIAALLGILRAGAAYLPLDPTHPPERHAWMVRDAGATMLALDGNGPEANMLPEVSPESLAYVMYTSGSTGTPKGVAVTHRNVVRLVRGTDYAEMDHTWLQYAPVSFDVSTLEIWAPLLNGGRLVLFPGRLGSLTDLARVIESHGVTSAWLTSGLFHEMVDGCLDGLRPLRQLLAGGDVVSPDHARRVLEALPGLTLIDGYGPTEGTTFTCCHHVTEVGETVPIGRPIANARVYVLDDRTEPVPVGAWGELYAGGEGLARGYLDRPDLTAERFVPDPFGAAGDRLYRTGDRVRWRADGTLEFQGRLDSQLKIRGFRVEPAEVEAALLACPGVSRAAVAVVERSLEAFWVGEARADELRSRLRGRLPEPMVPSLWVSLPDLPLTPNGKVDRRALAALAMEAVRPVRERVPPGTPLEERLVEAFAEVLERDPAGIGVLDNFFELGGHSLLATRLVSLLHSRWGIEVPMHLVFDTPSLAELADRILERGLAEADDELLASLMAEMEEGSGPIPLRPPDLDPIPTSYAQERLWFLDRLVPDSPGYNILMVLRVSGDLQVAALERAFAGVVRRHEVLRTTFPDLDGAPVQRIAPPAGWTIPVTDLSLVPDPVAEAARLAREAALAPYDLARGPLLRTRLLRLASGKHVLLLGIHHIVTDLWAMKVLVEEVAELYDGRDLPELPIQYADFAVWQREWLTGEELERQVAFWRGELAGPPPALDLPTDRLRPSIPSSRGSSLPVNLGPELATEVTRLGHRHGATPFMVLVAALGAVCSRWSGQDDLVLGAPIANRQRSELEGLIGMFVNTLPLRVRTEGEPSFADLLARVRRTALAAYEHQAVPFEKLVEELRPPRHLGRHPLFQVMLAVQNVRQGPIELPGLTLEPVETASTVAKFDFTLTLEDGLAGNIEWATDLFDAATMERLFGSLRTLLAAAVESPKRSVGSLSLLSEGERRQVLMDWNDTAAAFPSASIPELFAEQAALRPDAVAVEQGNERLTYGELQARAERVARRLMAAGVRPEQRVAVLAERSPDLIAALLGILRAGAAYLPLDPTHPSERHAWMMSDAGATMLDLDGSEAGTLPDLLPDSLAYVMYTSGSTGTPKGVAVTHRNVVRLVRGADYAEMDHTWLQYAPASFDASTLEIWGPLLNGGRLVLFPGRIGSLSELARVIERHGVTSTWLTAGLFHEMVDGRLDGLHPLKQLLAGGDVVSPDHARRVLEAHPGLTLINGYGPTEGTTFTCFHRMTDPRQVGETVPIGRPIANARVYVLDDRLEPVPAGVWGELYAGGDGLARGYLDRPDLTAERFVPDPFGVAGDRLYLTGDRIRWRADGTLEFQGRLDTQLKIRGFRVEPAEIEAALLACPGVLRAAVVATGEGSGKGLRAFWVGEAKAEELRDRLRARLPEALVPSSFVPLADLPLTPNGKVDRKALAEIRPEASRTRDRVPPRTQAEELLATLWSQVLEVEEIGAFDDFFDLGGHSLLATQLVNRIREAFGVELPVSAVFEATTLAAQAEAVAAARMGDPACSAPILPALREGGLPLSFAQERLWFLHRLDPSSPAYNVPLAIRLLGGLDVPALERAFEGLVRRHEVLRTTFPDRGGTPVQRIVDPSGWTLPVTDLSGVPDIAAEVSRLALEDALAPFDLARGAVLRTRLLRLAPREHVLLLCIHHVAADLWAMRVLVQEVAALYRTEQGEPLPELPIQYVDFAVWQRGWLQGGELERQVAYWRRELAGAPPALDLPTDRPRPAMLSNRGASLPFAFGAGLSAAVARLGRDRGATPFMVLAATLGAVCSHWSGQDDLVLGTPIANRRRPELEGLIGMFANSLPLRIRLEGEPSFADLLARVRRTALEAYEHQDVPFEKLVEELYPPRDLSRHPLFQVVLSMQNVRQGRIDLPDLVLEPVEIGIAVTKFDLTVTLFETGEGLAGDVDWATDLFDAGTVARLARQVQTLLAAAADSPETPLGELPVLSGEESLQLLELQERRRAQAALAARAPHPAGERVAPRNPLEENLVEACAEVLERAPGEIGAFDNFFDLGGHSLLATRFVSLLESRWGIEVPLQLIFDAPHLAALADRILERELTGIDDELLASLVAEMKEDGR